MSKAVMTSLTMCIHHAVGWLMDSPLEQRNQVPVKCSQRRCAASQEYMQTIGSRQVATNDLHFFFAFTCFTGYLSSASYH